MDVTLKTFAILMWNTSNQGREEADLLIQPDIDGFRYYDLSRAEELFRRGEEAARKVLDPYT
jgi:predicted acylesterase/phospholipase RssA